MWERHQALRVLHATQNGAGLGTRLAFWYTAVQKLVWWALLNVFPHKLQLNEKKVLGLCGKRLTQITISEEKQFNLHMKFVIPFLDILRSSAYLTMLSPVFSLLWWNPLHLPSVRSSQTSELVHFDLSSHRSIARLWARTFSHQNKLYRECQPIKWERYPCMRRTVRKFVRVTGEKIDIYHRGNLFLPLW